MMSVQKERRKMIKALDEIWNEIKKIENKINELKRKESDIVYCED